MTKQCVLSTDKLPPGALPRKRLVLGQLIVLDMTLNMSMGRTTQTQQQGKA